MSKKSSELASFLAEFVRTHPGLRLGKAFGAPAAFAGRRMFAVLCEDALCCRLPEDLLARELAGKARRFAPAHRGAMRTLRPWVSYRLAGHTAMVRLVPLLEIAARHAVESSAAEGPAAGKARPVRRGPRRVTS